MKYRCFILQISANQLLIKIKVINQKLINKNNYFLNFLSNNYIF